MTLRERAYRGGAVRAREAAERAEHLKALLDEGEAFKRAAWAAGVSVRTARRYRAERFA